MTQNDQIIEHARSKGWIDADQGIESITPSKYHRAALAIRPGRQAVVDSIVAAESFGATLLRLRVVPNHVAATNRSICENCPDGLFALLKGDKPVCTKCNCANKFLEAKWKDSRQSCPFGYWDNKQQEVTNGTSKPVV